MVVHAFIQSLTARSLATSRNTLPLTTPAPSVCRTLRPGRHWRPSQRLYTAARRRVSATAGDGAASETSGGYEPVEDGVSFPEAPDAEVQVQASWLEIELRSWLDGEWQEERAWDAHRGIANQTARAYARLRVEGMHDCSSLLLAIGQHLEGLDFSKTYTGPWNVANKTADLLLRRFSPDRFVGEEEDFAPAPRTAERKPGHDAEQAEGNPYVAVRQAEAEAKAHNSVWIAAADGEEDDDRVHPRRPASPNLADEFERYRFLQMVLDGTAIKPLIDGAVALAMGFEYDIQSGTWTGSDVTDAHFIKFGDSPPDILGDETSAQWTDSLLYLHKKLGLDDDDDGKIAAGLQVILETLHGVEMTRIQEKDDNDHAFKKRVAVVKWLHLLGGF